MSFGNITMHAQFTHMSSRYGFAHTKPEHLKPTHVFSHAATTDYS
jgi:hypothetical protein